MSDLQGPAASEPVELQRACSWQMRDRGVRVMDGVKEHPILFSAPMIRALLAGTKTQTRRCLYTMRKFNRAACVHRDYPPPHELTPVGQCWALSGWRRAKPGHRLWVRESTAEDCIGSASFARYTADGFTSRLAWWYSKKACPSIHMPRWASRIDLEVADVRVERLQDISEVDAYAEGIEETEYCDEAERLQPATGALPGRYAYRALWESINGPDAWAVNPWVWVVEFRRVVP